MKEKVPCVFFCFVELEGKPQKHKILLAFQESELMERGTALLEVCGFLATEGFFSHSCCVFC